MRVTVLVGLILVSLSFLHTGVARAATCSQFQNQAAAQAAANTRDADGDGIYCEDLPCPCSTGGESNGGGGGSAPNPSKPKKRYVPPAITGDGRYRSPTRQIACILDEGSKRIRCSTRRMASDENYYSLKSRGIARLRDIKRIRGGTEVPYGHRINGHGFSCLSTIRGFKCSNRDGHGMTMSRQNHARF